MPYTVHKIAAVLGLVAVLDGCTFATVFAGVGKQSAARLWTDGSQQLVMTGAPWSEAVAMNNWGILLNAQMTAGKTYPMRQAAGPGVPERLELPEGHTAAKGLSLGDDGTVYGWSMGRVAGKATYHAVVWAPGTTKPRVVIGKDYQAIGDIGVGTIVFNQKTGDLSVATEPAAGPTTLTSFASNVAGAKVIDGVCVGAVKVRPDADGSVDLQATIFDPVGGNVALLDLPDEESSVALGFKNLFDDTLGYVQAGTRRHAAIFHGKDNLEVISDQSGIGVYEAVAMDNDGTVVGIGEDASGAKIAWFAAPNG